MIFSWVSITLNIMFEWSLQLKEEWKENAVLFREFLTTIKNILLFVLTISVE